MVSRHLYLRQRDLRPSPFTNRHSFLHLGTATPLCSATVTRCIPEESGIAAVAAAGITAAASTRGGSSRATVVVSGVGPRLDVVVRSRLPWLGDAMRRVLLATCASCSTRLEVVVSSRLAEIASPLNTFVDFLPSVEPRTTLYPKVTSYMYIYIYIVYICINIYRHASTHTFMRFICSNWISGWRRAAGSGGKGDVRDVIVPDFYG